MANNSISISSPISKQSVAYRQVKSFIFFTLFYFFSRFVLFAQSYRRISKTWSVYSTWWILITRVYLYITMYMAGIHSTLGYVLRKGQKIFSFFHFIRYWRRFFLLNLIDFHIILFFLRNAQKKELRPKLLIHTQFLYSYIYNQQSVRSYIQA